MFEVGGKSVEVALHGEIKDGAAHDLLKDKDFVFLVLHIASPHAVSQRRPTKATRESFVGPRDGCVVSPMECGSPSNAGAPISIGFVQHLHAFLRDRLH